MDDDDHAADGGSSASPGREETSRGNDSSAPRNLGGNRSWMYKEREGKLFTETWKEGLDNFLDHAFSLPEATLDGKSHCPCTKCV